jgi:hypothetical protein
LQHGRSTILINDDSVLNQGHDLSFSSVLDMVG